MSIPLRFAIASANLFGSALGAVGVRPVRFDPDDIIARAKRQTGLSDLGDWPYPEGLEVACRSIEDDTRATFTGRFLLRDILTMQVVARLRLIDFQKRYPERFETPLNRPLIVLGLPRSGTTFLHRLLTEAPDAVGLPLWYVRQPFHTDAEGPDDRQTDTAQKIGVVKALSPDVDAKHRIDPDIPEEELGFFDPSGWTFSTWRVCARRTHLRWVLEQDATAAYRTYRKVLTWVQSEHPGKRLVLKIPNHVGFIDILREVVPEADIVQTHRDPVPVVASYCSLASSVRALSGPEDPHILGEDALHQWSTLIRRGMDARQPGDGIADVQFSDVVSDPKATVLRLHEQLGLEVTDAWRENLDQLLSERKRHRYGKHTYALEDYGLDAETVRAGFADYIGTHLTPDTP